MPTRTERRLEEQRLAQAVIDATNERLAGTVRELNRVHSVLYSDARGVYQTAAASHTNHPYDPSGYSQQRQQRQPWPSSHGTQPVPAVSGCQVPTMSPPSQFTNQQQLEMARGASQTRHPYNPSAYSQQQQQQQPWASSRGTQPVPAASGYQDPTMPPQSQYTDRQLLDMARETSQRRRRAQTGGSQAPREDMSGYFQHEQRQQQSPQSGYPDPTHSPMRRAPVGQAQRAAPLTPEEQSRLYMPIHPRRSNNRAPSIPTASATLRPISQHRSAPSRQPNDTTEDIQTLVSPVDGQFVGTGSPVSAISGSPSTACGPWSLSRPPLPRDWSSQGRE